MTRRPLVGGFTLLELLAAMTIIAVLLGVAVPSFATAFSRARLEGVINELGTDLQYARSAAIRRQAAVTLSTSDEGNMYTIRSGQLTLKVVLLPLGTSLSSNVSVGFEPLRGMANAAQLEAAVVLLSPRLRVVTNAMGRVQMCSPDGGFSGYARC